jgi:hypothetical protein
MMMTATTMPMIRPTRDELDAAAAGVPVWEAADPLPGVAVAVEFVPGADASSGFEVSDGADA